MFDKGTLLITGGTGSFGNAILERFLYSDLQEIRIFSRDEKKQDDLRKKYKNNKIKFYIGDIKDQRSISQAMRGVNFVFHAAALKQVPSCEFHPMQAVHTNILGAENVMESAIYNNVKKIILLSTDKAVYPINAMGLSKALMEKSMVAASRNLISKETTVCATRFGNVINSRGSVIPLFINQIKANKPITITNPKMTRFMMTLAQAVDLVMYAFHNCQNGDLIIQKSPAASIFDLATAVCELMGKKNHPIEIIGTRHGEKLFETLLSKEEMYHAENFDTFFKVKKDERDLNYENYFEEGKKSISDIEVDFNSHNTYRLNLEEIKDLLFSIDDLKEVFSKKDF